MAEKPKVAFYWCASCGGCEEAVVDLAEDILKVVEAVDIVFWPVAMDFKREDVEKMEDGEILASFINGGVRLSEQEEMVKLLRKKSKVVVAYGACSHLGGVPGLANLWDRDSIFDYVYRKAPSVENPEGTTPKERVEVDGQELELPEFYDDVKTLDQVIEVDYYIPGCPPTPKVTLKAIETLLSGELPPKGSVLAGTRALCYECPLNETKPEKLLIKEFKRVHQVQLDPEKCYLSQGVLCMGPITRGGCEALCISGNMPCTGCFGPLDDTKDVGGKAIGSFASILDLTDEVEIEKALENLRDPLGTFYRYSLPSSFLRRRIKRGGSENG
jgi:F420-non-reducing hydrogenase small subunit